MWKREFSGLLVGFSASIFRHLYLQNQSSVILLQNPKEACDILVEKEVIHSASDFSSTFTNSLFDQQRSYCALRITGPINSITVEQIISTISSYVKHVLPQRRPDRSKESKESLVSKGSGGCWFRTSVTRKNYDKLSHEGSLETIAGTSDHEDVERHEKMPTCAEDVALELNKLTDVKTPFFFILDVNHVSYFDHIGLKQFKVCFCMSRFPETMQFANLLF